MGRSITIATAFVLYQTKAYRRISSFALLSAAMGGTLVWIALSPCGVRCVVSNIAAALHAHSLSFFLFMAYARVFKNLLPSVAHQKIIVAAQTGWHHQRRCAPAQAPEAGRIRALVLLASSSALIIALRTAP